MSGDSSALVVRAAARTAPLPLVFPSPRERPVYFDPLFLPEHLVLLQLRPLLLLIFCGVPLDPRIRRFCLSPKSLCSDFTFPTFAVQPASFFCCCPWQVTSRQVIDRLSKVQCLPFNLRPLCISSPASSLIISLPGNTLMLLGLSQRGAAVFVTLFSSSASVAAVMTRFGCRNVILIPPHRLCQAFHHFNKLLLLLCIPW